MKKLLVTLIVFLAMCGSIFAQYVSHWPDFDHTAFMSQSPFVAAIELDGEIVTADNHPDNWNALEVAFFVGDQCRGAGVAVTGYDPALNYLDNQYVIGWGDPYPIINGAPLYYNTPGEVVTVRMYDHVNGIEYNECTVTIGNEEASEPYVIYTGAENDQGYADLYNCIILNFSTTTYESHWPDFDHTAFMSQSPFVAAIELDGEIVTADNHPDNWNALEVAFFVGEECRGAGVAVGDYDPAENYLYNDWVEEFGDPYPIINGAPVFYNNPGEVVTIKMYDHVNGIEYNECTVTYLGEPHVILTGEENSQFWDDFENPIILHFTTPCEVPTNLSVSDVTAHSVTLNWTESSATEWVVAYKTANDEEFTEVTVSENPYTIEGLNPVTTYNVMLQANCGTAMSAWTNPVSFTTTQYESHWPDFRYTAFIRQNPCVAVIELDGDIVTADNHPDNWNALEVAFFVGDQCRGAGVAFCSYYPAWNYLTNEYVEDYGDPFPMIDGAPIYYNNPGEVVSVKMYDHVNGIEYNECTITYLGEPYVIVTGVDNNQGWYDPETIIILHFTTPCEVPTNLSVSDVTAHSVTLNWTESSATEWVVAYKTANDEEFTEVTVSENPYTIEGLNPATTYNVMLQANCGIAMSTWTNPVSFTTTLYESHWPDFYYPAFMNMDYIVAAIELDGEIVTADNHPDNWNALEVAFFVGDQCRGAGVAVTGYDPALNYLDNQYVIGWGDPYPIINGAPLYYNTPGEVVTVRMYDHVNGIEYNECTITYLGEPYVILTGNDNDQGWYDPENPIILHFSPCEVPTNLSVSDVTAHSVTLNWTESSATEWVVAYKTANDEEFTEVTVSENPYTIEGLNPATTYNVMLQANCGIAMSTWTNPVSFTTLGQQAISLNNGTTWVSFNVETTLDDLKAALVAAAPAGTIIKINGQNNSTTYVRNHWQGNLTWDLSKMFKITVENACEITLEGMPINPADHPVTLLNGNNYLGFPFNQEMTLLTAFAGFAVNSDKVSGHTVNATYTRGRWNGSFSALQPGKGYIYNSAASEDRTFVFPVSSR